ncbi:hypothetical protein SRHO_G00207150 [Serrasalmus rhombeus]
MDTPVPDVLCQLAAICNLGFLLLSSHKPSPNLLQCLAQNAPILLLLLAYGHGLSKSQSLPLTLPLSYGQYF